MAIAVAVEREGRSVTALTARLEQGGRLCVLAVAAFGVDYAGAADWATAAPAAPPPQDVATWSPGEHGPPIAQRIETRPVFGAPPFAGGAEALTLPKGMSVETARLVSGALTGAKGALSATEVAELVGLSRVSARRYLEHFVAMGQADVRLRYGSTGRPERRYRWEA